METFAPTALEERLGSHRYNKFKVSFRFFLPVFVVLALLAPAPAYIRNQRRRGVPLSRADFENIQFVLHESTAPGLTNRNGGTVITAGFTVDAVANQQGITFAAAPNGANNYVVVFRAR